MEKEPLTRELGADETFPLARAEEAYSRLTNQVCFRAVLVL